MISTVILVHADFDIARGCKALRSYVAAQSWKPAVAARATAALTAMGDLILNSDSAELVPINLTINNVSKNAGIALICNLYLPDIHTPHILEAVQRLKRATDSLDIYETAGNVQITAHLHVS